MSHKEDFTVQELMTTELVTLEADEDIDLAERLMLLGRFRHLPIVDGNRLVGVVTHRDILRVAGRLGRSEKERIVARDIMTEEVYTVTPDTPVVEVARQMFSRKLGCVPIVDGENHKLVGITTEADFVELVLDSLELRQKQRELAREHGRD